MGVVEGRVRFRLEVETSVEVGKYPGNFSAGQEKLAETCFPPQCWLLGIAIGRAASELLGPWQ